MENHELLPVKSAEVTVQEEGRPAYAGPRTDGTKDTSTRVRVCTKSPGRSPAQILTGSAEDLQLCTDFLLCSQLHVFLGGHRNVGLTTPGKGIQADHEQAT